MDKFTIRITKHDIAEGERCHHSRCPIASAVLRATGAEYVDVNANGRVLLGIPHGEFVDGVYYVKTKQLRDMLPFDQFMAIEDLVEKLNAEDDE